MSPRLASVAVVVALGALSVAVPDAARAAAPSPSASAEVIAAYSLAAPVAQVPSGLVVRAVLPAGATCPDLVAAVPRGEGVRVRVVPMRERPAPATTAPAFDPITVCSADMPVGATGAAVGGRAVPASMPSRVERLAIFGDSGCRIVSYEVQDCANPANWPLSIISESIAAEEPDAVLFAGDFFYREDGCPAALQALCGSSPPPVTGAPFTDSAYGWIADVLLPMTPLLSTVPLIVSRGNHEACYRGGNGYFLLFDPRPGTEGTCAPVSSGGGLVAADTVPSPTYAIDLPVSADRVLRLAIADSAGGSDTKVTSYAAVQRVSYERAATLTAERPGRESWLVTHRPLYGFVSDTFATPGQPFNPWTSADQNAAAAGLLGTYDMVVSSHIHIAQSVQLPGLPGQLVMGNGGTLLDPAAGYPLPATAPGAGYPAPSWAWVSPRFGYALATPNAQAGSWRISMRDPAGQQFARCGLRAGSLFCTDTP